MVRAVQRAARQRSFRRRRLIAISLLVVLVVLGSLTLWYRGQANANGPAGAPVVLRIPPHESTGAQVDLLASHGVVTSALAYRFYLFFHDVTAAAPGKYAFRHNMSFGAVDRTLTGGPNVIDVTIPAGFTVAEIARRVGQMPGLDAKAFLHAVAKSRIHSPWLAAGSSNVEGLLAPGTYDLIPGEHEADLLKQMVQRFDQRMTAFGITPKLASGLGVTPNELVTVASIVQKEGYLQSNMPKVARVIYNRLAKGMPLQMDSTVLYSEGRDGGQVTQADEQIDTPYNTYLHAGLPPTPVSAPSVAALEAAAHPAPGTWQYFVVIDRKGTEAFTDNYQQQLANEQLARQNGAS